MASISIPKDYRIIPADGVPPQVQPYLPEHPYALIHAF